MISIVFIIIAVLYLVLITCFALGFDKVDLFKPEQNTPRTTFSIVIPFRNEANNLTRLLDSLYQLEYNTSLFEILLVNDNSEDDSVSVISEFIKLQNSNIDISILHNSKDAISPKKDAITLAINNAKYDYIITTDADCIVPKNWLNHFNDFIMVHASNLIVAPVNYIKPQNFLDRFQQLDNLSLQAVTIGAFGIKKPFLCNGANLCYSKTLFIALKGFQGNTHLATGDDMFFLEKAIDYNANSVHYLKHQESVVFTSPEKTWSKLIAQRVRWASKAKAYNNSFSKACSIIVFLINASVVALSLLTLFGFTSYKMLLYLWFLKFNIDLWLIYKAVLFFNQKTALKFYWFSFLLYAFFSTYVAIRSQMGKYSWKNRRY